MLIITQITGPRYAAHHKLYANAEEQKSMPFSVPRQIHPYGMPVIKLLMCNASLAKHCFQSVSFPESIKHRASCAGWFLYNCLKHFMMPTSKGCRMPVQFGW
jgi:hypothetical protein